MTPRPPFGMVRSFPLARFGVGWRSRAVDGLFRFPSAYPDLDSLFTKAGFEREGISLRGHTYLRRLPLGGKLSPKVTDEGAILYPTFPCRRIRLSPGRRSSPAPLGESVAPSSAPVCALGHLPPEGKALGVGSSPLGSPTPPAQPTRPVGHTQQVRAAARKKTRRAQPTFPPHRLARQGTPRRVSPPAGGERKSNHVLTGSAGQNILLTPRVPASPARFGVHPPILGGASCQAEPLTPPYAALPNEAQPSGAPPKILTPAGHPYGKAPPASPPKTPPQ